MLVAIYQTDTGGVAIVTPTATGTVQTLLPVFKESIPAGTPFWVIEKTNIPEDWTYRDAWELDVEAMGTPTDYGVIVYD